MLRTSSLFALPLLALTLAAGCFSQADDPPAEQAEQQERGPIGKADLYGQCMEIDIKYCGGKSSGNCWCDEACESYGDCCSDYQAECSDDGPSCDPTLICGQAISCVGGQWYPTTCGPANCDSPMGPCGGEKVCGGFMGQSCDAGEYCEYDGNSCGFADQTGVCKPMPDACGEIYAPVCGCDGKTYGNECEANSVGVSVKSEGACDPCGGCQAGYECQYCWGQSQCVPEGAQC